MEKFSQHELSFVKSHDMALEERNEIFKMHFSIFIFCRLQFFKKEKHDNKSQGQGKIILRNFFKNIVNKKFKNIVKVFIKNKI